MVLCGVQLHLFLDGEARNYIHIYYSIKEYLLRRLSASLTCTTQHAAVRQIFGQ